MDFNLLSLPPSVAAFWTEVLNAADDKGVAILTFEAASSLLRASKPVHHARTAYELVSTHLVRQTADTTEYLPLGKLELDHAKQTVKVTINPELMPHLPAMRAEIERDDLLNTARIGSLHARALYRFVNQELDKLSRDPEASVRGAEILTFTCSIPRLRKAVDISPGTYPNFSDFKRFVIDHSAEALNAQTDMNVLVVNGQRQARTILNVIFYVKLRPPNAKRLDVSPFYDRIPQRKRPERRPPVTKLPLAAFQQPQPAKQAG